MLKQMLKLRSELLTFKKLLVIKANLNVSLSAKLFLLICLENLRFVLGIK